MALSAGSKPSSYSSSLSGLSQTIYNNRLSNGVILPEAAVTQTIESTTYTEDETLRRNRILSAKLDAYVTALSVITELQTNAEIKTLVGGVVVETYAGGVGTNGGALNATPYPVSGTVKTTAVASNIAKVY